jgi:hypothetical protein
LSGTAALTIRGRLYRPFDEVVERVGAELQIAGNAELEPTAREAHERPERAIERV